MNYHIVRTNESINKIALTYNLSIDEIKNINLHISSWNNLIPGTRLKLPPIPETLTDELNDIEPFIEDYYPKVDISRFESLSKSKEKEENQDKMDPVNYMIKTEENKADLVNISENNVNQYTKTSNMYSDNHINLPKQEKNVNFLNSSNIPLYQLYPNYFPYFPYPNTRYLYPKNKSKKPKL